MANPAITKTKNLKLESNVTPDEIKQTIDRVMASKHFAHAPMKQKFLRLICDFHIAGRGAELNEYLIGREVFDRDNSYNPATDPIVRVGAHGVREKLERYYQKEGVSDEVRIEIPIGSYEPNFIKTQQSPNLTVEEPDTSFAFSVAAPVEIIPAATAALPKVRWKYWPHLATGLALAIIAALVYSNVLLRQQLNRNEESIELFKPVWGAFLQSTDPTLLVLSNPPVFRFLNSADPEQVIKKSFSISTTQSEAIFDELPNKSILRIIPNPRLALTTDTYTGIGEAVGVHRITDLFRTADKNLRLKQSRTVSAEDLQNQNVVALGSVWVNNWSSKLPVKEEFAYTNQVTVRNLNPQSGEQSEYSGVFDPQSGKLTEDYALITVAPNLSSRDVVMVVAGLHSEGTAAAAEFITAPQYLSQFNQRLAEAGTGGKAPKYFQALLKVGVDNGIPTFINLVAVHELRINAR
jgi:hypothetical protein